MSKIHKMIALTLAKKCRVLCNWLHGLLSFSRHTSLRRNWVTTVRFHKNIYLQWSEYIKSAAGSSSHFQLALWHLSALLRNAVLSCYWPTRWQWNSKLFFEKTFPSPGLLYLMIYGNINEIVLVYMRRVPIIEKGRIITISIWLKIVLLHL